MAVGQLMAMHFQNKTVRNFPYCCKLKTCLCYFARNYHKTIHVLLLLLFILKTSSMYAISNVRKINVQIVQNIILTTSFQTHFPQGQNLFYLFWSMQSKYSLETQNLHFYDGRLKVVLQSTYYYYVTAVFFFFKRQSKIYNLRFKIYYSFNK